MILFWIASTIILAGTVALFFVLQNAWVFAFGGLALWYVVDLRVFHVGKNLNSEGGGYFFFTLFGAVPTFFLEGEWKFVYLIAFLALHFAKMLSWLKYFDKSIGEMLRDFRFYIGIVLVIAGYVALPIFAMDNSWVASLILVIAIPSYIVTSAMVEHYGDAELYDGEDDANNFFAGVGYWGVNFLKYLGLAIASPFILIFKLFKLIWEALSQNDLCEELGWWFWVLLAVIIVFGVLALTGVIVDMAEASNDIFGWLGDRFSIMGTFPILNWYMAFIEPAAESIWIIILFLPLLVGLLLAVVADIIWLILQFLFTIIAFAVCGLLIFVFFTVLPGAAGIACLIALIKAFADCDKDASNVTLFVLLLLLILAGAVGYYIVAVFVL